MLSPEHVALPHSQSTVLATIRPVFAQNGVVAHWLLLASQYTSVVEQTVEPHAQSPPVLATVRFVFAQDGLVLHWLLLASQYTTVVKQTDAPHVQWPVLAMIPSVLVQFFGV